MTIEEIKTAELETVEARALEIAGELETAEPETLDTLSAELDAIQERKAEIRAAAEEKRAAMRDAIDAAEIIEPVEIKEERKTMEKVEIRKTPEYLTAWVSNALGHANAEQRALLSENATNADGTVAVPAYVDDVIHTAWESNDFLRRIRRTYYPGNLKVGYEISAPHATVHEEGSEAITDEELELGVITMIPQMIKKFVSYSDEAADINENFARYIVDEVVDRVIKGIIDEALAAMNGSNLTQTHQMGQTFTTEDIITAAGMLKGAASPVVVTTRSLAAVLKGAALNANFWYDPFDGMDVVYVENLPSWTSGNDTNFVAAFVADLSAVTANFPNGDDVKIKVDELTAAAADMVKVYGRLYAAVDVTAPGKVVKIVGTE